LTFSRYDLRGAYLCGAYVCGAYVFSGCDAFPGGVACSSLVRFAFEID
tara:strand:+ start:63 stop:206 length:144 start_codon:yes stop_codon:yes gene_type:complete